jgi:hypothetical protein
MSKYEIVLRNSEIQLTKEENQKENTVLQQQQSTVQRETVIDFSTTKYNDFSSSSGKLVITSFSCMQYIYRVTIND